MHGKDIAIGPIKSMYLGEFSTVSPIEIGSKAITFRYVFQQYAYSNVYAYTLLKEWEELFNNEYEISIDYVLNKIKWHKGFGFDYEMALEVLDEMSIRGYIKLK